MPLPGPGIPIPPLVLTDALRDDMAALYRRLDEALSREPAPCDACGACCHFARYDHQMWLTNLELAFLLAHHALPPANSDAGCPWLHEGRCTARAGRAIGCRVFHCRMAPERMADISAEFTREVQRIAEAHQIDLTYAELLESLAALRR